MPSEPLPSAGYSGKPLAQKLGLKPGHRAAVVNALPGYWELLEPLPSPLYRCAADEMALDFAHLFVTELAPLPEQLGRLKEQIVPNGMIWVSWPKRASEVPTDVTEDRIREVALAGGLVDVKVCAVDATWSGLKLVIPLKGRPG